MENISVLTDFEQLTETRSFKKVEPPTGLEDYGIFIGGNFIFIANPSKRAVRFNLANFETRFSEDDMHEWIKKIKKMYPGF